MKIRHSFLIAGTALLLPVAGAASAQGIAAYQSCIACHGEAGQGNADLDAPVLAGQDEAYLARQLTHFQAGIRGGDPRDTLGAQMKAMVVSLGEEDIAALASYLAGLAAPSPAAIRGDFTNGKKLYQGNCGACHGPMAKGNPSLNAPGLAWQDAAYLKRQYNNFSEGLRGAHPDDTYGRQMKMMANSLPTEKDLDDVIAHIQSLALE